MEMSRGSCGYYTFVFAFLICVLALGRTEGKRRAAEMVFLNQIPHINQEMVEQAWIHCSKELFDAKDSFEDFDLHMPPEAINDMRRKLTRRNRHNTFSVLPPQMQRKLVDCLRKRCLLHIGASAEGSSSTDQVLNCVELLVVWRNAPRRSLASKSQITSTHVASPVRSPAPVTAAPSPSHSSAPVMSRVYGPKASNLVPTRSLSPNSLALLFSNKKIYERRDTSDSRAPSSTPKTGRHSLHVSRDSTQSSQELRNNIKREILVAVAGTAAVTFCFVAMIFCCWLCCKGRNNKIGPRDRFIAERPLLHLSDFSPSSSQNSLTLENSSSKDHSFNGGSATSFKNSMSMKYLNHLSLLAESPSMEANTGEALPPLKLPPGKAAPPHPGPPPPPPTPCAPRPPPPPKVARAPPAPPPKAKLKPSPLGPHRRGNGAYNEDDDSGIPKAKLKPFFWDKVMANPDTSMVWHEISAGSFQFNEEMIESLFGYNAANNSKSGQKKDSSEPSIQYIQIIDTRKAQNLSILLRALNVTMEEVLDALQEGNELPMELLQTLLKMAPTPEEELKLRLFAGNVSQLGPAERFLKILVEIPFAFKRIEALLFMSALQEEVPILKESLETLEVACNNLRNSRLFLKLLEAVLKTGNRMNDGTYRGGAQAFKLDTLLKLSDVKGTDGKTTLLHFVVQEIIRSEGIRAVRTARAIGSISTVKPDDFVPDSNQASVEHYRNVGLHVVSGLSSELKDVKRAAVIDADGLTSTVSKLRQSLTKTKAFLDMDMKSLEEDGNFYHAMTRFADRANEDISSLSEEEKRIMALVKSTADYFHGNARRDEGLRLFTIVRDFLIMLDRTCKDVKDDRETKPPKRTSAKEALATLASLESSQSSDNSRHGLFPAIAGRRINYSSSDDESTSP